MIISQIKSQPSFLNTVPPSCLHIVSRQQWQKSIKCYPVVHGLQVMCRLPGELHHFGTTLPCCTICFFDLGSITGNSGPFYVCTVILGCLEQQEFPFQQPFLFEFYPCRNHINVQKSVIIFCTFANFFIVICKISYTIK